MELKKEIFDELKQLDRIEYRQKLDLILKSFPSLNLYPFFTLFILTITTGITYIALMEFGISSYIILDLTNSLGVICLFVGFILLVTNLLQIFGAKKRIKKLNEEYFKIYKK